MLQLQQTNQYFSATWLPENNSTQGKICRQLLQPCRNRSNA